VATDESMATGTLLLPALLPGPVPA
jgi:hypothetical protein